MRSILLLLAFFWASAGAFAEESSNALREAPPAVGKVQAEEPSSIIPEPTATLLAGLGGLALLFFATRRKVG